MDDLTRPYLFPVRPRHLETLTSYTARLQNANFETEVHQRYLTRLAQAEHSETPQDAESTWSLIVQAKTGRDTSRLLPAGVPAVVHPDGSSCRSCTDGVSERYLCTLCAHGRLVKQHPHFDMNVCIQHRRWVGPSSHATQQFNGGNDLVRAELGFRKLRSRGLIDAASYLAMRRILSPLAASARVYGAAADVLTYPILVRLSEILTGVDFCRRFFDPNRTFADAFTFLSDVVDSVIVDGHKDIVRSLWLYFRPTFLNVRESLERGAAYAPASAHDFPLRPSVVSGFRAPIRPLEPFARYLAPTGDHSITPRNHLEVLAHNAALPTSGLKKAIATICRAGHRVDRTPQLLLKHAREHVEHCGICDHRILLPGYNDMATTSPEHALEFDLEANFPLTAQDVFAGSPTSYHWKCTAVENHRFEATASNRTAAHSGCPLCLGRLVIPLINDAESFAPHLAAELHPTKNAGVKLNELWFNSTTVLWWICEAGHTFRGSVRKRTHGSTCHHCDTKKSSARTIARARPDFVPEFDLAGNYPRTPEDVKIGSKAEFLWICPAKHSYKQRPERRNVGYGCSTCSGRKLNRGVNDAATRYPAICTEWHRYLNMVEPRDIVPGTNLYFWECKANKHLERQSIPHRVLSGGCTTCDQADRVSTIDR